MKISFWTNSEINSLFSVAILMKAIEQYLYVALFIVYKRWFELLVQAVDEILIWNNLKQAIH